MNYENETTGGRLSGPSNLEQRLREAEAASGIGAFVLDLSTQEWAWTPAVATLFGFDSAKTPAAFDEWLKTAFVDDAPKILRALDVARDSGSFYVEFRVKRPDGPLRWLAGKGQVG